MGKMNRVNRMTDADREKIKKLIRTTDLTNVALGKRFDISSSTIALLRKTAMDEKSASQLAADRIVDAYESTEMRESNE